MSCWQTFLSRLFPNRNRATITATPPVASSLVEEMEPGVLFCASADDSAASYRKAAEVLHEMEMEALDEIARSLKFDPEKSFILDDISLAQVTMDHILEGRSLTYITPELAYHRASEELRRRKMDMFVIPHEQFTREWNEGVMKTMVFRFGNQSTAMPSCPLSEFTRVVEDMVNTGNIERAPSASSILSGPNRRYYVHIHNCTIRAVTLVGA